MQKHNYIVIRRHGILFFYVTVKFFFLLLPVGVFIWIFYAYNKFLPIDLIHYIVLPAILIMINYIFLQIILHGIDYLGRIMIIGNDDSIVFIHTSLLLIDDFEFMDIRSILKVDVERHGFIPNILNFGHLLLEQRKDIRTVHYIPHPHSVSQILRERIPTTIEEEKQT